jgi:hypothetical protein
MTRYNTAAPNDSRRHVSLWLEPFLFEAIYKSSRQNYRSIANEVTYQLILAYGLLEKGEPDVAEAE